MCPDMFERGVVHAMKIGYFSAESDGGKPQYAVYAYDQDALIGYGELNIDEQVRRAVASVKVDRAYERRDVQSYIVKLLQAECKYYRIEQMEISEADSPVFSGLN